MRVFSFVPARALQQPALSNRSGFFYAPCGLHLSGDNSREGTIIARTPTGTVTSIATVLTTSKATTAVTNAAEASVTSTAHGVLAGDIVEMQSGWANLHRRAFKVKSATANDFVLADMDTTNLNTYPAGGGVGSFRKVTTWTPISRTMNPSSSGGEPQKVEYKFIESPIKQSLNDGFAATERGFDMDADDIGTPGYLALRKFTESQEDTVIRKVAKNGSMSLLSCTVALNEEEKEQEGQIVTVSVSVSGNSRSTKYSSAV